MSIKEEVADLFIAREQTQQRLAMINQQLQQKMNELHRESEDDRASKEG